MRPTIKDLQNLRGKRKIVLTTAFDYYTARACELAGIDVIVTWPQHNETMEELLMVLEQVRKALQIPWSARVSRVTRLTSMRQKHSSALGKRSKPGQI